MKVRIFSGRQTPFGRDIPTFAMKSRREKNKGTVRDRIGALHYLPWLLAGRAARVIMDKWRIAFWYVSIWSIYWIEYQAKYSFQRKWNKQIRKMKVESKLVDASWPERRADMKEWRHSINRPNERNRSRHGHERFLKFCRASRTMAEKCSIEIKQMSTKVAVILDYRMIDATLDRNQYGRQMETAWMEYLSRSGGPDYTAPKT